jgi:hypothetical protein
MSPFGPRHSWGSDPQVALIGRGFPLGFSPILAYSVSSLGSKLVLSYQARLASLPRTLNGTHVLGQNFTSKEDCFYLRPSPSPQRTYRLPRECTAIRCPTVSSP